MNSKFITIIRPSFMAFCEDACRAAAFNHLLFRIAGKSKDQPKEKIVAGDILWYAKTEQITEEIANAWGVCKVRKEVNSLIGMGIIGRCANPEWGADRTKHFCFGNKECKRFLQFCEKHEICVVHLGLSPEVTHLIYISSANDTCIKCTCANDESIECIRSNHQMETIDISDANDKSIEAIPIDIPTKDDTKEGESTAPASLSAFAERKKATDEHKAITQEMLEETVKTPAVKPPQQTSTSQSQARGTPDVQAPPASVASTAQTGAGADLPAMALTAKQIKQQNDRRAKDIWAIIERERQTKYSRIQRELYENSKGMECLLNDEIDDETLVKALGAMDPYQGRNFTLLKFYGWMPNLTAGTGPPSQNGTSPACQDDPTLGISGFPKLHPRRPRYA